jgi:SAM-dependent methyltransferase
LKTVAQDWWASFYTGTWLEGVLSRETDARQTHSEATLAEAALGLAPGAQVLDLACGVGRHSLVLAARGYQMTGFDFTLPFLEKARDEAARQGLSITWQHGDMRELSWSEKFDGVICFGGGFGYFDDAENAQVLRAVCRALRPGGSFLLDTHIMETILPAFQERDVFQTADRMLIQERWYDHVTGRIETEWTRVRGESVSKRLSSMRLYSYRELRGLLVEVGFGDLTAYGSLTQEPFKLGSPRLYIVATKEQI